MYTNISKPTGTNYTNLAKPSFPGQQNIKAGYATGIIGPPTYSQTILIPGTSTYTNILKPT